MKDKILIVYTGGTICSFLGEYARELNVSLAKSVIVDNFSKSNSKFAHLATELFEDSHLNISTLSENMTIRKLNRIIENIKSRDLTEYKGVIVLHGTDTLAYTGSLLSVMLSDSPVPVMLVSANRPPDDPLSNANVNFRTAVELILNDIAPNVYVPYRNSNREMNLHIASTLIQCPDFSEDFHNSLINRGLPIDIVDFDHCRELSEKRYKLSFNCNLCDDAVLLVQPYTGLDYSRIDLDGIKAVVHGTYHSGTLCVERGNDSEAYSTKSVLHLADRCRNMGISVYAAPSSLGVSQYSSAYDAVQNGGIVPLNMTSEMAYAKAVVGVSMGYSGDKLTGFMLTDICSEMRD